MPSLLSHDGWIFTLLFFTFLWIKRKLRLIKSHLALALSGAVYTWNPSTGETQHLFQLEGEDYISSVSWIDQGSILAVGSSNGQVQVS